MKQFAPLHVISGYTFLSSGLTIEKIKESVIKENYYGVGLTDFEVLHGVPLFCKTMENNHIPFIIGMDIKIDGFYFSLFANDENGYSQLVKISSYLKENIDIKPIIKNNPCLIGVLDTSKEETVALFKNHDQHFYHQLADFSHFFSSFYLGINIISKETQMDAKEVRLFARERNYKTIAFPEIRYQKKDDAIVLNIVNAIKNNTKLKEKKATGNQCFLSEEDYFKIYSKEEIKNTINVVSSNHVVFSKKRGEMLHYPVENSVSYLKELCHQKLKELNLTAPNYLERLNNELEVIIKMGYADYFLIVQDYVNYARSQQIAVGPGRGSAAGSLVSYVLGITEIDPLKYHLQFERFLTIYRKTMPDIDIDFMDIKRGEIVNYMRQKYGQDRVANIVTFQTILAKQSIRDIGRIYDYRNDNIDLLCKSLTLKDATLREEYKKEKAFRDIVDSDPYFLEIVALASKIEGLPRQEGMHASGIIVNNKPIKECLPIKSDFEGHLISQYEMDYLEEQGFLKMDFLGLRNLTTIDYAIKLIHDRHPDSKLTVFNIPYQDPEIFKLISQGMTMGIFQLESFGMRLAINKIKPKVFEDIVLLLALYRPGPMDNINDFVARKNGKVNVTYLNEKIKTVLEETYGVIVYQEQVNSMAQVMAGFSLAEADVFRRAVSKKKKEVLQTERNHFISGCLKQGYSQKIAETVYNDILKFADYGFNKSHAVGYAMIASRMAYLKQFYPLEFYASILETASSTSDSKFPEYVSEIKKRNYAICLPDINHSSTHFEICEKGLLYPLSSIKEINSILVNKILDERNQNGEFKDFFDFVLRMYPYKISEKQIARLISSGAFDCFHYSRASLMETILPALQYAELNYNDNGQMLLSSSFMPLPQIPDVKDNPLDLFEQEFEALGIMLGENPLKFKKDSILKANASEIATLMGALEEMANSAKEKESYYYNRNELFINGTIVGIVQSIKTHNTRKTQSTMAFMHVFDQSNTIEVLVFPKIYSEVHPLLVKNNMLVIKGKLEMKDEKYTFIANEIKKLED